MTGLLRQVVERGTPMDEQTLIGARGLQLHFGIKSSLANEAFHGLSQLEHVKPVLGGLEGFDDRGIYVEVGGILWGG